MKTERLQQLFSFLEKAPEDPFTLYSIGYEYLQANREEEARGFFHRVIKADPDYVGVYYHLGKLLEAGGNREGAENTYKTGLTVAQKVRDANARRELQAALNHLLGEDED